MANQTVAKRNRPQVIIMLIAFPILSIFATYSLVWLANRDTLLESTNHGRFVDPPVLARQLGLADAAGVPVDGSGSWWIWLVTEHCDDLCEQALAEMRGTRERLDERADEVRQALVMGPRSDSPPAAARHIDVAHFTSDGEERLQPGIYLVDPVGNVVLTYPADTRSQPMYEDLARLLGVSEDA